MLLDPNNSYGSDSDESLLSNERDSFADEQIPAMPDPAQQPFRASDVIKEQAKNQAIKGLNKPLDRQLARLGSKTGMSPQSMAALSKDTDSNRDLVKQEAKKRARDYASDKIGKNIADEGFKRGFQKGLSKEAGALAKEGAQKVAGQAAAKVGAKAAAQGGTKAAQTVITAAGAASGPETLGLGFLAAMLLNIAISLGVGEAIDCLFELKNGNVKKAGFHAIKAIYLVQMFIVLLVAAILCLSVAGIIIGGPLVLLLNIYAILGMFFPNVPHLQGLSRKWMLAILILLDLFLIILIVTLFAGIIFGICTQTAIGSMLGWGGAIGDAVNYLDNSRFGTGGYLSALNEVCRMVQ